MNHYLFRALFCSKTMQTMYLVCITPPKLTFKNLSVQPESASVVCRMFMFRGIYSQFPPSAPPNTHTHFHSFSFTPFITHARRSIDKARRIFRNDYKTRQVSNTDTFYLYVSFCLVHNIYCRLCMYAF